VPLIIECIRLKPQVLSLCICVYIYIYIYIPLNNMSFVAKCIWDNSFSFWNRIYYLEMPFASWKCWQIYRAFHNVLRDYIYNNNNCSQPQENWKSFFFWPLEIFDVCTTGTWHTSIRYSSFSHTHVNMGQQGHYIHSHRLAAEMWTTIKNLLGEKFLSCSFYPCRFRKYVSYWLPITKFVIPEYIMKRPAF
jgi:hypothetical protein